MKPSKFTLHADTGRGQNRSIMAVELSADKLLCNEEPVLPGDSHPYNMRLWVIGHEFGAKCAVWASDAHEALDVAVDKGLMDSEIIHASEYEEMSENEKDECLRAGNASEPLYSDYLWIHPAVFDVARDWELLKAFARCDDHDSLDY